ncbi:MAG: DUF262 domain-containing protein [Candidatus Margulisbacteria bacterium]|jgi:hypothetical protein|nr:DUF262 domain-containing protein [Candidatus Margulisiibacteriota bacterium]
MTDLLQNQIETKRKEISPDKQYMTIGELANLYKDEELIINPDFQRYFRWNVEQKTKLIESVLLNIPLPPIFIFERKDGKWEVIDGLQRLSSLFEFMGILKNTIKFKQKHVTPLVLCEAPYLTDLNKKQWNNLSEAQQRYIKRAGFDIVKLKFDSAEFTKYELFQRLNRGGTPLTEQEIRNCMIIMENKQFLQWMEHLALNKDFVNVCARTDRELDRREDLSLITRYLCLKNANLDQLKKIDSVEAFLNKEITSLASNKSFNINEEEKIFNHIFKTLNNALGSKTFRKHSKKEDTFKGGFYLSLYDVVVFAMTRPAIKLTNIKEKIISLQHNPIFSKHSGAGKSTSQRWRHLLDLGLEIFNVKKS